MITVGEWLRRAGRPYPEPDMPDGRISGRAFARARVPMIVHCTGCKATMPTTPELACDGDGQVYCGDCLEEMKAGTHPKLPPRKFFTPLEKLAIEVSTCAPERIGPHSAYIPWKLITAIRTQLEADGYDWRAVVREYRRILRERSAR